MTNEERIEERLIHAHERGYYHKVLEKVSKLKLYNPKIDHYEAFEMACTESKQEWLQSQNLDSNNIIGSN
jgi:hypothetical protein